MKLSSLVFICLFASKAFTQTIILPSDDDVIRYGGDRSTQILLKKYKRDLAPYKLQFENNNGGQKIVITFENRGNVRFEGEGSRAIEVKLNGESFKALMPLPIEAGEIKTLVLFSDKEILNHCDSVKVEVDTDHNALQLGDGVYSNDSVTLSAFEFGQVPLCL